MDRIKLVMKNTLSNNYPTMGVPLIHRTLPPCLLGWVGKVRLRFRIEKVCPLFLCPLFDNY